MQQRTDSVHQAGAVRGLTADIYAYWRAHRRFPTTDREQFFAEPQFEAYRALVSKSSPDSSARRRP